MWLFFTRNLLDICADVGGMNEHRGLDESGSKSQKFKNFKTMNKSCELLRIEARFTFSYVEQKTLPSQCNATYTTNNTTQGKNIWVYIRHGSELFH